MTPELDAWCCGGRAKTGRFRVSVHGVQIPPKFLQVAHHFVILWLLGQMPGVVGEGHRGGWGVGGAGVGGKPGRGWG